MQTMQANNILDTAQTMKMAGYHQSHKIIDIQQGAIYRAQHRGKSVVIKVTNSNPTHSKTHSHAQHTNEVDKSFLNEIAILKYLSTDKHCPQSIVKYVDSFKSDVQCYLVMEDGGHSVLDFVNRAHKLINIGELDILEWHRVVKIIFKQMIECIDYIHSKNVCHFDISLENFLINDVEIHVIEHQNGRKQMKFKMDKCGKGVQIKLTDYGLSEYFCIGSDFQSHRYCGKINYASPEITNGRTHFNAKSNDIWCLGVCLFVMMIGNFPWLSTSNLDAGFKTIMHGNMLYLLSEWNKMAYINQEIYELFEMFLQYEHKRINMQQLKQCKWLHK